MGVSILGAILLNAYAVLLVVVRAHGFGTRLYRPMLWNVWLSIAPVLILVVALIAWLVVQQVSTALGYVVLAILGGSWLVMLPNASYLITELNQSHRTRDDPVPLWFDIILVIALAMSGVANTVVNVLAAHAIFVVVVYGDEAAGFVEPPSLVLVGAVLVLVAFGMYLGRYPRFNSWDLKHPAAFVRKLRGHFGERANRRACAGFTVTYAIFLGLIYLLTAGPVINGLVQLDHLRSVLD